MQEAHARATGATRRIDDRPTGASGATRRIDDRPAGASHAMRTIEDRLAGAPISWGACEVPGWGVMPAAERVLSEMAELRLMGTELGAPGFLPDDPARIDALLKRHGLELVGGFVALVVHEPDLTAAIDDARKAASLIAQAGGQMFVLGVVQDVAWSAPRELDDEGWTRLAQNLSKIEALVADHGLTLALHPHAGTLIETAEQVERAIEAVEVGWCLDTGHLTIGGTDPVEFTRRYGDRVVHVHLKDVDATIAGDFRAGRRSLADATRQGLFLPLGRGDARIAEVMGALQSHGYDGWLVLEQDTAITGHEPTVEGGPMRDARESIAFLHHTARTTEENNR